MQELDRGNNLKNFSLGEFTDKILQYANQTFSILHHKFLKEIWGNNRTTNKLHSNQCFTDWQNGYYECYIPTRDDPAGALRYSRVAIQILPEISNRTKHAEAEKLSIHRIEPLGTIESEFLIIVAYKQDKRGLVKGFKHEDAKGYFTGVFVSKQRNPELIWKRILDHMANFYQKRLDGLMRKLGFETWVWKWAQKKLSVSIIDAILVRFSSSFRQTVHTFLKLFQHFMDKMSLILKDIGAQNVALKCTVRELRSEIEVLQRALNVKIKMEAERDCLRVLGVIPYG